MNVIDTQANNTSEPLVQIFKRAAESLGYSLTKSKEDDDNSYWIENEGVHYGYTWDYSSYLRFVFFMFLKSETKHKAYQIANILNKRMNLARAIVDKEGDLRIVSRPYIENQASSIFALKHWVDDIKKAKSIILEMKEEAFDD